MSKKVEYSFEQWCLDNNRKDLLDRWDYQLNDKMPSEVSYKSNKKYWFKCPRNIHDSQLQDIQYFATGRSKEMYCTRCNSFAQYIIDNYNEEYLEKLIKINNDINLWDIAFQTTKQINIICFNNDKHIYPQSGNAFVKNGCPYCAHRGKPLKEDSLGYLYPEVFEFWSNKNKKTPYDYYPHSGQKVWWKCQENIHKDYQRQINSATSRNFKCTKCIQKELGLKHRNDLTNKKIGELLVLEVDEKKSKESNVLHWKCLCSCGDVVSIAANHLRADVTKTCGNRSKHYTGENNSNWKGGITPERLAARTNLDYKKWRKLVYQKDWYTCQCCGEYKNINKQAHHLVGFAENIKCRYDVNNGITMCDKCHYPTFVNSFHNIYGTINNTPEQLEEFINNKRKELGISLKFSIKDYKDGINILKPIKNIAS